MNPRAAQRRVDRLAAVVEADQRPGPEALPHCTNSELARSLLSLESLFSEHFGCGPLLTADDRALCLAEIAREAGA